MPIVLCVEDSEVDRRLMRGLLERDVDWLVQFAASAEEALEKIEDLFPHIIVTDLQLPGANGLELVRQVRDRAPDLPVILATGHGSENLAVDALEMGAASYVPKEQMAEALRGTIEQVLGIVCRDEQRETLNECMTGECFSFALRSDPELIAPLVRRLQQTLKALGLLSPTKRMHVGVALEEALLNALYHGNLALPADVWRRHRAQLRRGVVEGDLRRRLEQAVTADRRVFVEIAVDGRQLKMVVRDQGKGFDVSAAPVAHDAESLQAGHGRGLVLMRNFLQRVDFNAEGNQVTMSMSTS
ncbi:MAG: response regulator [Pirellulales bacterium]